MTFDEAIKVIGPLFLASLLLSFFLPILSFKHNILRRSMKIVIIVATFVLCIRYIQSQFYVEPYFPSYNPTVYVTDYGSSYHEADCGSLWRSSHSRTLYEVVTSDQHYSPCLKCNPPRYSQTERDAIAYSLEDHTPDIDELIYSPVYLVPSLAIGILVFVVLKFNIYAKLEDAGFIQSSKIIGYICILCGFLFLPGILLTVTLLMGLSALLSLLSLPFAYLFPLKKRPAIKKSYIIADDSSSLDCTSEETFSTSSDETYYYTEAANGMTVRVPESKLKQWQEAQDRIRRGEHTEKSVVTKQALDRVLQRLYHSEDNDEA